MTETTYLKLPLVQPSQAQKHVTVNEALARLDAALQLSVESSSTQTPPSLAEEGQAYLVPVGAVNAWENQDGTIAFYLNGGWDFLTPLAGWTLWVRDEALRVTFDGAAWVGNLLGMSPNGATMRSEIVEADVTITAGATVQTGFIIPAQTSVWGVTGIVLQDITGTLSDWSLGVTTSATRYGSGLGLSAGSFLKGLTGQPQTYYGNTSLLLSANGGDFSTGEVRLAVHLMQFGLPSGT